MEKLKQFTEVFFKNLKCKVGWKGEVLVIEKVPEGFERAYGKKSPYYFVFSSEYQNEESDLISKGSSLIKTMNEFLKKKTQKSLFKLDLDVNVEEEIKKVLNIGNLELTNLTKSEIFDYIFRFSFSTTFQYRNKKEQVTNHVYIHDTDIIENFDLEDYRTVNGNKEEVKIPDLNQFYELAKERIKSLIKPKIEEFSKDIEGSLEIEVNRIKSHYVEKFHEVQIEIDRYEKKIEDLLNGDLEGKEEKIKFYRDAIEKVKEKNEVEKLEKERDMYITDEKHKHSLNISNDLINTSIIYYPIYKVGFFLKSDRKRSRLIALEFNPLTKQLSELNCDSCSQVVREVFICDSGHVSCKGCLGNCVSCFSETCSSCEAFECSICGKGICKSCLNICNKCGKKVCDSHVGTDYLSDEKICSSCSSLCPVCNKFTEKQFFKKCSKCRREICPKCLRVDVERGVVVCRGC